MNSPRLRALSCVAVAIICPVAARAAAPAAPAARPLVSNPGAGGAAAPKPAAPLPPARAPDAIIADMIAAVGGAAALQRHKSLHTTMEITFKGLGITGTAEHWAATGDRTLTTTTIPNVATSREGSDGKRFWSEDPINGLRILEGAEAEQARIEGAWNAELRMKELFTKIEARNELGEGGQRLECLVLIPKVGGPITECVDATTHLLVVQKGVRSGPQGEMPYTARLSDWRAVGDVKVAHASEMQVGPLAFTGRVVRAEVDVAIDAGLFAVPGKPALGPGGPAAKATAKPSKKPTPAPAPPAKH